MGYQGRRTFSTIAFLLLNLLWLPGPDPVALSPWLAAQAQEAPCGPNPIVCENRKAGDADFDTSGAGGPSIQGFATDISVNVGQTVSFKIAAPGAPSYRVDIYRLGYYGGAGARKVATISPSALPSQPDCIVDQPTGLVDCGNWIVSASWEVPADAVSGVYVARPSRPDNGETSHIVFIVRDDNRAADVLVQTSDTTWQAYNRYGGASLYCADDTGVSNVGTSYANSCGRRATKVSYNRPIDTRAHAPQSFLFSAEYPMLRFLEANGYDVKYWAGVDTDRRGGDLVGSRKPRVFISSGHDEYWSGDQRAQVEAARGAGVSLAFFSGNEVYWKTRYEASTASTDVATSDPGYRTLVSYKDTLAGFKIDPMPNVATGTWRDTRFGPPVADGGRPENALMGAIWTVNSGTSAIKVPAQMASLRFWRHTRIPTLGGDRLAPSSLGYEWGEDLDNGARPGGVIHLSLTTVEGVEKMVDFGSTVAKGTATHSLTLYRHDSGALVFGASTVQWAWGLDAAHDDHGQSPASHTPDPAMQQATVNLLADMDAQPGSLQSGLVATSKSDDIVPPSTIINSPADGGTVGSGDRVTITGTAVDSGGGVVAGVEVSVDDGATWHPAAGTAAWSFEWLPGALGTATLRARAIDDSANRDTEGVSATLSVVAGRCPCPSIWSETTIPVVPDSQDPSAVELGLKFRSDVDGFVKGVRFYKSASNTGTHIGNLWTTSGRLLASATFVSETPSGWQEVLFDNPIPINAHTLYVVSYHTNVGHYSASSGYFTTLGLDASPIHVPPSGAVGGNGVFAYGPSSFPTQTFNATNYWVDVVFDTAPDSVAPLIADVHAAALDGSTATISWSTDEVSTSSVEFSTDSSFPAAETLTVTDATLTMAHNVRIAGLRADTRYYFRLTSTDRAGNTGTWPSDLDPPAPDGPAREFTTPKPMLHDTTPADFGAGTASGTYIAEAGDGEVVLAPAAGAEFSGTTLPAEWSSIVWSPGGSATVHDGVLIVDGARVAHEQMQALAGHSLEFVATFTGDPFQHSGYGQTLASVFEPFALFSTSWVDADGTPRAGGSLAVRTSIGDGFELSTNLGVTFFNAPHRYRIEWEPTAVTYFVDGIEVASHPIVIAGPMRPVAASDFSAFSGTIAVDWMRMTPYATSGTFVSRVYDAGGVVDWQDINWTVAKPDGAEVSVSVRSGNVPVPDDSWTDFAVIDAPGPLALRSRYIQYRALLASSSPDRSPELRDITIASTGPTLTATDDHAVAPENGRHVFAASGAGSLVFNDDSSDSAAALRVVAVTPAGHGTATLEADGSVTYTPAPNYHGADAFGYTVSDGLLAAAATVTIDVQGNISAVANRDAFETREETVLTVSAATGLLANDTDAESDPISINLAAVSQPAHGSLTVNADGSFTYVPQPNFAGVDAFTYKVHDGFDDSGEAIVEINVTQVNDAPAFVIGPDQTATTSGLQTVTPWATGINAGPNESGQALAFIVTNDNPALFAVQPTVSPTGVLTYTPHSVGGMARVTVVLRDSGGTSGGGADATNPQEFTITVVPANLPPVVNVVSPTYVVNEGSPVTLVASGSDPDPMDEIAFAWDLNGDGAFETAGSTVTFTPPDGPLTLTPRVKVTDRGGLTAVAGTTVVVHELAPSMNETVVWNGDATVVEPVAAARTAYMIGVSFTDAGVFDRHTVTYSWGDGSAPSAGVVSEGNGSGSAVGTHTYTQAGFYVVRVTITDESASIARTVAEPLIVVDPAGKYQTGLGSFSSPVGSFAKNPSLAGLATINSLTARYGVDGTLTAATNSFRFTYASGGLSLTSTRMSWLVVNGNRSWLKGEGNVTIAGVAQPVEYLVATVDATASPNVDRVRVRIVSRATGATLYDTQNGAVFTAEATTRTPNYTAVSLR